MYIPVSRSLETNMTDSQPNSDKMQDAAADKARKERSPSFPFIPLPKAIERARSISEAHKRQPARLPAIAETWGYGTKSSGLLQTVAALKAFGLMEDMGSGEDRKVLLSDLAWRILHDTRPGAREQAIQDAALRPRLIAEYAQQWLPDRPSDSHCISELHLDRGFTADAAKLFLRVFDETAAFANLSKGDSLSSGNEDKEPQQEPETPKRTPAGVGDFVQWASQGALQFPQPRRVREVVNDPVHGPHVFVEGAQQGFPMDQIEVVQKGEQRAEAPPVRLPPVQFGSGAPSHQMTLVQRATFPLPEGVAALEVPEHLSPESYEDLKDWIEVMMRRAKRAVCDTQTKKLLD
jgi:hypothetical protein